MKRDTHGKSTAWLYSSPLPDLDDLIGTCKIIHTGTYVVSGVVRTRVLGDPRPLILSLASSDRVWDLEVRRGSLEDAYLAIVNTPQAPDDDGER